MRPSCRGEFVISYRSQPRATWSIHMLSEPQPWPTHSNRKSPKWSAWKVEIRETRSQGLAAGTVAPDERASTAARDSASESTRILRAGSWVGEITPVYPHNWGPNG